MNNETRQAISMVKTVNSIFDSAMKRTMPATETDPSCDTPEYAAQKEVEIVTLLQHPEKLLEADIDDITAIYRRHSGDMLDLGESIHRYYVNLAENQADNI